MGITLILFKKQNIIRLPMQLNTVQKLMSDFNDKLNNLVALFSNIVQI